MNAALLVAAREFRQVVSTRGFWVMLLILPVAFAASIVASTFLAPQPSVAYVIADASGRYAAALERRLETDYQRAVLRDLATYVDRWKLSALAPAAPWARRDRWSIDAEVARFVAQGGLRAALRLIDPHRPAGAPAFKVTPRLFIPVPPPPGVRIDRGADAFGRAIAAPLQGDVATPAGKKPLALALYIPANFGEPGAVARIWTNGRFNGEWIATVRDELSAALRLRQLAAAGIAPAAVTRIVAVRAPILITEPSAGKGRGIVVTRSFVPLALVYLLLVTAISTGSMMLQGLIEERSNKLLESVLACIRPADLMLGKLLGLGAVGLVTASTWAGCAVAAAYFSPGIVADLLRSSLDALDGPWIILALLFYFLGGYLIVSMLFLAIGSLSDSMQDAQSYLMPVIMLIMVPVLIMMQASLRGPDAIFTHILSWIPLYTPFAMLARLGNGVPLAEIIGTGILLAGFIALELLLLGRLFRASLLNTGQPGGPRRLIGLMLAPGEP